MSQVTNASFAYTIKSTKRKAVLMDNKKFGQFILQLRKEKGWTQEQLANSVGVKRATISKYESGAISPTIDMVRKINAALNGRA